jgi:hypothetical protein
MNVFRWSAGAASISLGAVLGYAATNSPTRSALDISSAAAKTVSTSTPVQSSPIDFFRDLLGMTSEERNNALTNRSPYTRKQILTKLREYEAMKPEQRELRLRVTELRWYLLPIMKTPATNRLAQLALTPPDQREIITDRLREWDALPPAVQKELLDNEAGVRYFTEMNAVSDPREISVPRRIKLELGVSQWQKLPAEKREKILDRFNQFFDLRPAEKEKALSTLSEAERRQIEKTLHKFDSLPAAQRALCLKTFDQFANMSLVERHQFLKNAERWKTMSLEERQSWRDLVNRVSQLPPTSPDSPTNRRPPRPIFHLPKPKPALATNGN